jgi:RNA polymerase sigma-70 factor (ECF subfamily)
MRFDVDTADEVAQQTWLKVCKSLPTKPANSPFQLWLMQIARNSALDHVRRKRPAPLPDDGVLAGRGPTDVLAEVEENSEMDRLRHCLAKLPDTEQAIVQRRLQGVDSPAIAAQLGLTSDRVHRLFHDAKAKLQRCLGVSS